MQKTTRLSPIIFTLNNADDLSNFVGIAFSWVSYLFHEEESSIHRFIQEMNYFTKEQFILLNTRISNKRNKSVPMNEKHFIIMYAVLFYCGKMIQCKKEVDSILEDTNPEVAINFKTIKDPFINFANNNTKVLNHDYKNNHTLAAAMARINTFQIPK